MAGILYIVATPIGNLEDLTIRAARLLGEVSLVAAESTRTARTLLRHLQIAPRCVAYNDRNKARASRPILAALEAGESVAMITDAGTPGISDPGQDLVAAALAVGARVVPIPGPSAVATLLSVAGVRTRTARILGFLPRRHSARQRLFREIGEQGEPALAFESPHRLAAALEDLATVLPDAHIIVGRELTKLHEEIWRGSPAAARRHFDSPRGEFSLLIAPLAPTDLGWSDPAVQEALRAERAAGRSRSQAAAAVAQRSGRPRRAVYALWPADDTSAPGR